MAVLISLGEGGRMGYFGVNMRDIGPEMIGLVKIEGGAGEVSVME
jgi:hypothetical protein